MFDRARRFPSFEFGSRPRHWLGTAPGAILRTTLSFIFFGTSVCLYWGASLESRLGTSLQSIEADIPIQETKLKKIIVPAVNNSKSRTALAQFDYGTVVSHLNYSLSNDFEIVESEVNLNVGLVSIEASPKSRELKIVAESLRIEELFAYADRLGRQNSVDEVHILDHMKVDDGAVASSRLTFSLHLASPPAVTLPD